MQKNKTSWAYEKGNEPDKTKTFLSSLSLKVRKEQYEIFLDGIKPKYADKIADVGVSSAETLPDVNYFEKVYPYPEKLTAISIDNPLDFKKRYPKIVYKQINPGCRLPYRDNYFDIVVSWATLEHVGDEKKQQMFIDELFRIGKKVYITTPYRGCLYEPHSGLFFVHWLPRAWFHRICGILGKEFWCHEGNLRCLWKKEIEKMLPKKANSKVIVYRTLGLIPSHLLVIKD